MKTNANNTPSAIPADNQPTNTGTGGVADLMELARTYLAEKPTSKSDTPERLGLVLGHFFMALMPRATQHSILTITGFCLSQLALQRMEEHNARRNSTRVPARPKRQAQKASAK